MSPLSRRMFLQLGGAGLAGLSFPEVLRARSLQSAGQRRETAVILYMMAGGPSHHDTFDMKPSAPEKIRGPFKPIATKVNGLQVCELLPHLARSAEKFSLVRSLHHRYSVHDDAAHLVQTGYAQLAARQAGQKYPAQGSVVSQLREGLSPGTPPYVCIPDSYHIARGFYQKAAFLGAKYDPLNAGGQPILGKYRAPDFVPSSDTPSVRLAGRRELLQALGTASEHHEKAFEMLTSQQVQGAFDLAREPVSIRERYGSNAWGQSALLARRLVEAGVSFVTINHYEAEIDWWDDHTTLEKNLRRRLPIFDQALATLLEDLDARGLSEQVLVVAMGEFGRNPQMNAGGGRDHWPGAFTALLSGGGIRGGQIIGSTSSDGGSVKDRPTSPGDLLATIYRVLGIDMEERLLDKQKRPIPLVEEGEPIRELF